MTDLVCVLPGCPDLRLGIHSHPERPSPWSPPLPPPPPTPNRRERRAARQRPRGVR